MSQWKITYMGEGVTALDGVGVFARHTTARVAEGVATKLKGDSRWVIVAPDGATSGPAPAARAEKPEEKKPEAKAEEKRPEEKKPEEKKPEAKAEEKTADAPKDEKKKDEKPAEKKADEKPADKPKA